MRRVYAVVEGSTEEGFVKAVLRPHLLSLKVAIEPIIVTTKRFFLLIWFHIFNLLLSSRH